MGINERRGKKTNHTDKKGEIPSLGYYIIVTDTKETEKNYFNGLRDSLPQCNHGELVIRVEDALTKNLVDKAIEFRDADPQYRRAWVAFDRDRVLDFDDLINKAEINNIDIAWSNPCIEIWFHAHFGEMPVTHESAKCVDNFEKKYKAILNQEYSKSEKNIYKKLCTSGNESNAIQTAQLRLKKSCENCNKPSDMLSTSTIHKLLEEIHLKTSS